MTYNDISFWHIPFSDTLCFSNTIIFSACALLILHCVDCGCSCQLSASNYLSNQRHGKRLRRTTKPTNKLSNQPKYITLVQFAENPLDISHIFFPLRFCHVCSTIPALNFGSWPLGKSAFMITIRMRGT